MTTSLRKSPRSLRRLNLQKSKGSAFAFPFFEETGEKREENAAMKPIYKRVLIKLSGEALGKDGKGFNAETIERVAQEIVEL